MAIGRQRELTLVAIMFVLGAGVSLMAPQFLSVEQLQPGRRPRVDHRDGRDRRGARDHHPRHRPLGRGHDRPGRLRRGPVPSSCTRSTRSRRSRWGSRIGLVLGMVNGFVVAVLKVPAIVATLGTLSIFRGHRLRDRGPPPGPAGGPAGGLHRRVRRGRPRHPDLRPAHGRRRRGRDGAAALDPVRPPGLRGRQQPGGGRDPGHPVPARRVRRVLAVRPARRRWPASCGSWSSGRSTAPPRRA